MVALVLLFCLWGCVFVPYCEAYVGQNCCWRTDCGTARERCDNGRCRCSFGHMVEVGKPGRKHCATGGNRCVLDEDCYGDAKCIFDGINDCKCPKTGYTLTTNNICVLSTGVWVGVGIAGFVGLVGVVICTCVIVKMKQKNSRNQRTTTVAPSQQPSDPTYPPRY